MLVVLDIVISELLLARLKNTWGRHLFLGIFLLIIGTLLGDTVLFLWLGHWSRNRLSNRRWNAPSYPARRRYRCSCPAASRVALLTFSAFATRRSVRTLKLFQGSFELNNSLVEFRKVAANVGIYRDDIP